jgi:hypothetical protein
MVNGASRLNALLPICTSSENFQAMGPKPPYSGNAALGCRAIESSSNGLKTDEDAICSRLTPGKERAINELIMIVYSQICRITACCCGKSASGENEIVK